MVANLNESHFSSTYSSVNLNNGGVKSIIKELGVENINSIISELDLIMVDFNKLDPLFKNNISVSLAGGAIRSVLCGSKPKDLDIVFSVPDLLVADKTHLELFSKMPVDVKASILKDFREYLLEYGYIYKKQPIEESDLVRYLFEKSVYSVDSSGGWDIDKMFQSLESEDDLRKKYGDADSLNPKKSNSLEKVDIKKSGSYFFASLFSHAWKEIIKNEYSIQSLGKDSEDFILTAREKTVEDRWIKENQKKPRSESELDANIDSLNEIKNYSVLKGIRHIIKATSLTNKLEKDFIVSVVSVDDFVKTFDMNVLEMYLKLSVHKSLREITKEDIGENLSNASAFLSAIKFNDASKAAYVNKNLNFKFTGGEDFKSRLPRFQARLEKAWGIFPDFKFTANLGKVLIFDENGQSNYSKEKLNDKLIAEGSNIDEYSLLVAFVLNMILKDKQKNIKSVEELDNKLTQTYKI